MSGGRPRDHPVESARRRASLSFAGNAILEAVQKDLGVDYDEANEILENPGEERLADLTSIVSLVGEELAVGIEKSLSYLRASSWPPTRP